MAVFLSVLSINPQKRVLLGPEGKRDELVGDSCEARERQCAVDELLDDVEGIKGSLFSLQSEQRNGESASIHRDERDDLPAAHSPREQPPRETIRKNPKQFGTFRYEICLTLAIPVGLRGTALVGLEVAQWPHGIHYTIISHNPTTRTPPLGTLESPKP